jgi:hypothetical protein
MAMYNLILPVRVDTEHPHYNYSVHIYQYQMEILMHLNLNLSGIIQISNSISFLQASFQQKYLPSL